MRIISIGKWSAVAAALVFTVGCLEQQTPAGTKKAATAQNSNVKAYIQRDSAGIPVQAAPRTTATPPKVSKNAAPAASVPVHARNAHADLQPSHVRGARIYDDFVIELDAQATITAKNPLLALANEPSTGVSNTDSYRCSHCHGFDYEGGVYTYNGGATDNLLELRDVRGRTEEDVINLLFNGFNMWDGTKVVTVHNYSTMLDAQSMVDVSDFVVNEIFDTHQFIRAPSSESLGAEADGAAIYNSMKAADAPIPPIIRVDGSNFNCMDCHGADGKGGTGATTPSTVDLPTHAWTHPFTVLHRTLFGSPRSQAQNPITNPASTTVMPGLYEMVLTDGLHFGGPEQGAAVMKYLQSKIPPTP